MRLLQMLNEHSRKSDRTLATGSTGLPLTTPVRLSTREENVKETDALLDAPDLNTNGTTLFGRMVALLIKAVLPSLALISNPTLDNAINNGIAVY
jgi:hypothetical protein